MAGDEIETITAGAKAVQEVAKSVGKAVDAEEIRDGGLALLLPGQLRDWRRLCCRWGLDGDLNRMDSRALSSCRTG